MNVPLDLVAMEERVKTFLPSEFLIYVLVKIFSEAAWATNACKL